MARIRPGVNGGDFARQKNWHNTHVTLRIACLMNFESVGGFSIYQTQLWRLMRPTRPTE